MRMEYTVRNCVDSIHRATQVLFHNEIIITFLVAGRVFGSLDFSPDKAEPASGPKLIRSAIPIASNYPAARDILQSESNLLNDRSVPLVSWAGCVKEGN